MSSIFNSSFLDLIRRVETRSLKNSSRVDTEIPTLRKTDPREKFLHVLDKLQSSNQVNHLAKDAQGRGSLGYEQSSKGQNSIAPVQNEISNLTFEENKTLTNEFKNHSSLNKNALERYKISNAELSLEDTVKIKSQEFRLNPDPKSIISELPPPLQGMPPTAPKVISAKFTQQTAPIPLLPQPSQTATTEGLLEELIGAAGRHHGVDPNLSVAVARAESSLKVNAVSSDGHHSKGIFQLLDDTGKEMMDRLDVNGHYEPFDPKLNAHLGVGYLRRLHDLFSKETTLIGSLKTVPVKSGLDLEKISIAAFNAGEGRVARAQAAARSEGKDPASYAAIEPYLPLSTRSYVQRVSNLKSLADARDEETSIV